MTKDRLTEMLIQPAFANNLATTVTITAGGTALIEGLFQTPKGESMVIGGIDLTLTGTGISANSTLFVVTPGANTAQASATSTATPVSTENILTTPNNTWQANTGSLSTTFQYACNNSLSNPAYNENSVDVTPTLVIQAVYSVKNNSGASATLTINSKGVIVWGDIRNQPAYANNNEIAYANYNLGGIFGNDIKVLPDPRVVAGQ